MENQKGGEYMNISKLLLPVLAIVILGGSVIGAGLVNAQGSENPASTLVTRIAQRFNLNEADVKAVFNEVHDEHKTKMKADLESRLNQAVSDGKITEAQKQAILEKFGTSPENKINREEFKSMTKEERQTKMEERKTEIENWASENGLSLDTLREILGGNHPGKGVFMERAHRF